jgi:hypothetical protein
LVRVSRPALSFTPIYSSSCQFPTHPSAWKFPK